MPASRRSKASMVTGITTAIFSCLVPVVVLWEFGLLAGLQLAIRIKARVKDNANLNLKSFMLVPPFYRITNCADRQCKPLAICATLKKSDIPLKTLDQ